MRLISRDSSLVLELTQKNRHNSEFDPEEFTRFQVKRGLRNADGTGVVAGLTRICNVHGYLLNEGERSPIDGRLVYRGYSLNDIAEGFLSEKRFGFEEVAYLLLSGELPTPAVLRDFCSQLAEGSELPKGFLQDIILRAPSRDIMNVLQRAVLALYSYDDLAEDQSVANVMRQCLSIIAAMPKMMVAAYEAKLYAIDNQDMHFFKHDIKLSVAENILKMLRPNQTYTPEEARLLDLCLAVHADHGGGNNSTFTVRTLTSASTDTYSAIAAGIGSLKGFRHGGANRKVSDMLEDISKNVNDPDDEEEFTTYLEKIVAKQAGDGSGLIYGMGHAVYTLSDPRAVLLKGMLGSIAAGTEHQRDFKIASLVEKLAPAVLKKKRGGTGVTSANVDLYSGITYKTLGLPPELFTPMFCVSRTVGWCAHRLEELSGGRIVRPAYKSVQPEALYLPIEKR